jgi:hypothetical protein
MKEGMKEGMKVAYLLGKKKREKKNTKTRKCVGL